MENKVQLALKIATEAHGSINQKRKTGEDYITHPVAVMEIVASVSDDPDMLAAALLHDVIEDVYPKNGMYNIGWLTELFGSRVASLVIELTNEYTKEKYPHLNRKKRKELENHRVQGTSADGKTIKLADILHNCRGDQPKMGGFLEMYRREKLEQLGVLHGGNSILFAKATYLLINGKEIP